MKVRFLSLLLLSFGITMPASRGAVVSSGIVNIPIPLDFEGTYLRMPTGASTTAFPGDWSTAPWLNPFFGGVYIGTSPLFRPVITGADQIVKLAAATLISSDSNFAPGENGSTTHVGNGADQFQLGVPGYMGFVWRAPEDPPTTQYYGWALIRANNDGPGSIIGWGYEDQAGVGILAGSITSVPEPAGVLTGLLCIGLATLRRRRA